MEPLGHLLEEFFFLEKNIPKNTAKPAINIPIIIDPIIFFFEQHVGEGERGGGEGG